MANNGNGKTRVMPMGNPADYPIGSPESRAAARAMLDAMPVDIASLSDYELKFAIVGYYLKATNRVRRFSGNKLSRQEFIAASTAARIEDEDLHLNEWQNYPRKASTPEEIKQVAELAASSAWNRLEDLITGGPEWSPLNSWGHDPERPLLSAVIVDSRAKKLIPVLARDEAIRTISGSQSYWLKGQVVKHEANGWRVRESTDEPNNFRAVLVKKFAPQVQ